MKVVYIFLFSLVFHYNIVCQESVDSSSQLNNITVYDSTRIIDGNEKMPEIIGGLHSIQSKIIYPKEAKQNNIEGKVFIKCKITSEGKVEEIEVVKGLGFGCDEEAIRVVKDSKWKPCKINNVSVSTYVGIPLTFKKRCITT